MIPKDYTKKEVIHHGRRHLVLTATRRSDDASLVLKLGAHLAVNTLRDLQREYEHACRVSHDNVLRYLAFEPGSSPALVMEDRGEQDLNRALQKPLEIDRFLPAALQITSGLKAVHEAGLVHLDLNPSNILLDSRSPGSPVFRIIDLGSSMARDKNGTFAVEKMAGTLPYMSPEQTGRTGFPVDERSDLYGLGCLLYELLTGAPPFSGDDAGIIHAHLTRLPPPLEETRPDIPAPIVHIVQRLLAKDPTDRYQSAASLLGDLERCQSQWEHNQEIDPKLFELSESARSIRRAETIQIDFNPRVANRVSEQLEQAVARVHEGRSQVMLLRGEPGSGKTNLVKQLVRRTAASVALTCNSATATPYLPLKKAVELWARALLAQDDATIEAGRRSLRQALGPTAGTLVDFFPELSPLLPEQGAGQMELPPAQAKSSLRLLLSRLLNVVCEDESTVLFTIDDLDRCDPATLDLLAFWLVHPDSPAALFICVLGGENHLPPALDAALARIRGAGIAVSDIPVEPLDAPTLCRSLAANLERRLSEVEPLAELIRTKSAGNVYYINQLLALMVQLSILRRGTVDEGWTWDLERAKDLPVCDNVAGQVSSTFVELPAGARALLLRLAVMGTEGSLEEIAALWDQQYGELRQQAAQLVELGLLEERPGPRDPHEQESGLLRFAHPRFAAEVRQQLRDSDRKRWHLILGRRIRARLDPLDPDDGIFAGLEHLNQAWELMDAAERLELARFELAAGTRALKKGAEERAFELLQLGLELVGDAGWEQSYDLTLQLHTASAEAALLCGRLELVEPLDSTVHRSGCGTLDRGAVTETRILAFLAANRNRDAVTYAAQRLGELGYAAPLVPSKATVAAWMLRVRWKLRGWTDEALLSLPEMTDPRVRRTLEITSTLGTSLYWVAPDLMAYVIFKNMALILDHGYCDVAPHWFAAYGLINTALGRHETALRFAQRAIDLMERHQDYRLRARVSANTNGLTKGWRLPFEKLVEVARTDAQSGLDVGDLDFGTACLTQHHLLGIFAGYELSYLEETGDTAAKLCAALGQHPNRELAECQQILVRALRHGQLQPVDAEGRELDEQTLFRRWRAQGQGVPLVAWSVFHLAALYHLGEFAAADTYAELGAENLHFATASPAILYLSFYRAMHALERAAQLCGRPQRRWIRVAGASLNGLRRAARGCPENFLAWSLLVEARLLWLQGKHERAATLFSRATEQAEEARQLYVAALAQELWGRMMLGLGQRNNARQFVQQAIRYYRSWGAVAKAEQMERAYAEHFSLRSDYSSDSSQDGDQHATLGARVDFSAAIDMRSVMQSAAAIANEVTMERLIPRVLSLCAESAGASHGQLLLREGERWQSVADIENGSLSQAAIRIFEEAEGLAKGVVRYVLRTERDLRLDDAGRDPIFGQEPHIQASRAKSVLCVRMVYQGDCNGLVYLENRLSHGAFNDGRVAMLRILLGQAAVAVHNARLYDSLRQEIETRTRAEEALQDHKLHLEELVEQRTATLRRAQQQLIEASRRAGMAEVAVGVLHNAGNFLNSINISSNLLQKGLRTTELKGLEKAVEMLEAHDGDLALFLSSDSRGCILPAYLKELTEALKKENRQALEHIGRISEHVNHLSQVIAQQQGHARGRSLFVEQFKADELLEEAIKNSELNYLTNETAIVREYDGETEITSDRHRLLQILVNLLNNAGQSVDRSKTSLPVVTIRIRKNSGRGVLIEVADNGAGIERETLARIFEHGFTTRDEGSGFGLHYSANAAGELGATLQANSDGPGRGATFSLQIPATPPGYSNPAAQDRYRLFQNE